MTRLVMVSNRYREATVVIYEVGANSIRTRAMFLKPYHHRSTIPYATYCGRLVMIGKEEHGVEWMSRLKNEFLLTDAVELK